MRALERATVDAGVGPGGRARIGVPEPRRSRSPGPGPYAVVDEPGALLAVYERRGAGLKPAVVLPPVDAERRVTDENGGVTDTRVVHQVDGLAIRLSEGSVVTIGAYDGVHLGHRKVLQLVRELADARGLDAALVTFDRHPAQVVRPESAPKLLTSLDQKLELLAGARPARRRLRAPLRRGAQPRDRGGVRPRGARRAAARPGRGGRAPTSTSATSAAATSRCSSRWARTSASRCIGLGLVAPEGDADHEPFSSTRVRGALADGDVAVAATLLGRPHEVRGVVDARRPAGPGARLPDRQRGRPRRDLPPGGRDLRGRATAAPTGSWRPAAISLGRRPTFYEDAESSLLEAYLLDFDGDLYDQPAAVRFVERLRGEQRFESVEDLVEQMGKDVEATRRIARLAGADAARNGAGHGASVVP